MMRSMPPRPPCPNGVTTRTRSARTRANLKAEQTKIDFRYSGVYTQSNFHQTTLESNLTLCNGNWSFPDGVRPVGMEGHDIARSGADMFLRSGRPWTAGFSGPAFVASEPPFPALPGSAAYFGWNLSPGHSTERTIGFSNGTRPADTGQAYLKGRPRTTASFWWFGRSRRNRVIPFRME
jgi:hypothetical protein